ncbi:copper homeostasis protein CutC [Sinomicrobium soli]|uniref:copper homeostasis protein CutC n=1 Tax=Sinomicrobium sp. N-1-3-6 TaxID=2219864 RepID=UPI000DCCBAAD|nr:copper homeostasis protein CutC [Sinomicrobium sp. N-1-3-6]RAV28563.1 copper homeostasis protein CutC [Sinomicrobium sp. N-1-3-6]
MLVEICANSLRSARNAEQAGADRIELCSELGVGGVTPSHGLIGKALETLRIPVFVLIRPRSGDFCYDDDEFAIMKEDIAYCKEIGCAGIVSGVLTPANILDAARTRALVELSHPMEFTFHRAFDLVKDPLETLKLLEEAGADRVLTSGQQPDAEAGLPLLTRLRSLCGNRPRLMPGGGIGVHNIRRFAEAGFPEVHFSATTLYPSPAGKPGLEMNSPRFLDEAVIPASDPGKIAEVLRALSGDDRDR